MLQFRVNEYITLKLEKDITNVYISGDRFIQCKYLLLDIPIKYQTGGIVSIDDATEKLNPSDLDLQLDCSARVSPTQEFWGHCSNLQAWAENSYDTHLLHRNIAFPLLKRLSEVDDLLAKRVLTEEIAKRFKEKLLSVKDYLIWENYLKILSIEQLSTILPSEFLVLIKLYKKFSIELSPYSDRDEETFLDSDFPQKLNQLGFTLNRSGLIYELLFYRCNFDFRTWSYIIKKIHELSTITSFLFSQCKIIFLPKSIVDIENLKQLEIRNSQLSFLPYNIKGLVKLSVLEIYNTQLVSLPNTIGNLKHLTYLNLSNNQLKQIPDTIGNLTCLETLSITNNRLVKIPSSIFECKSLKYILLKSNRLNLKNNFSLKKKTFPKLYF